MAVVFGKIMEMSYHATLVLGIVLIARLIMEFAKIPKKYCCLLWAIPFVRLVMPFTIESAFSLLPKKVVMQTVQNEMTMVPQIITGTGNVTGTPHANDVLPVVTDVAQGSTVDKMGLISLLWLMGVLLFAAYGVVTYIRLKTKLKCSMRLVDNIYAADYIDTPFVLGILKPCIYIPSATTKEEYRYILAHEKVHLQRKDYLYKLAAFAILGLHWFNPFAWIAYLLLCKDMEMACDEAVMMQLGDDCKKEYAKALLDWSADKRLRGVPLAFSEGSVKGRIRNVLRFKKPLIGISIATMVGIAVLAFCLLSNPADDSTDKVAGNDVENNGTAAIKDLEPLTWPVDVEITIPVLSADMDWGADGAILDYADEDKVVFHGYFGLFVYDIEKQALIGAVDLEPIGCHYTQGSETCEVAVEADGSKVYLSSLPSNMMYVYDVELQTLIMESHDANCFKLQENVPRDGSSLVSEDGTIGNLCFVRGVGTDREEYFIFRHLLIGKMEEEVEKLEGQLEDMEAFSQALNSGLWAMDVEDLSRSGATFIIYNNSDREIQFGSDFALLTHENEEWVEVPKVIEDWAFTMEAYPVGVSESRTETIDWEWLYGELPDGVYLLKKTIMYKNEVGDWEYVDLGVMFSFPTYEVRIHP